MIQTADTCICTLDSEFRPILDKVRDELAVDYPLLRFVVGSATSKDRHTLWMECLFPNQPDDIADVVSLCVTASHLSSAPRMMADVCWGHPSGQIEASLANDWHSDLDWPLATPETLAEIAVTLPRLLEAFAQAVRRGRPCT